MTVFSTIHELLADKPANAIAFVGSGCPPLTYGGLREHVERTVASLNRLGIGRNDRVALVLPNGTEMASAFVAVAAGTTSAPLNPAYRADEFEFYLSDLKAKALIVERGSSLARTRCRGQAEDSRDRDRAREQPTPPAYSNWSRSTGGKTAAAPRGGYRRTGRHRPGAAHLRHHVAPQDRAADAAQCLRLGRPHPRHPEPHRPPTAASTSCRCSISTA